MITDEETSALPAVQTARTEVERLYQIEQEWNSKLLDTTHDLLDLESAAGTAVLDSPEQAEEFAEQIGRLKGWTSVAAAAIVAARKRRIAAIKATWMAEATHLRAEAAELRSQADRRQKHTDELLNQLRVYEGCDYVPWRPTLVIPDTSSDQVSYRIPRTQSLREQAQALEAQAAQREEREVLQAGEIDVSSREELVAELKTLGAWRIGPLIADVLRWLNIHEPAFQEWKSQLSEARQQSLVTRYRLWWRDGQLDERRS